MAAAHRDITQADAVAAALEQAAAALGRLNQSLHHHPLQAAFLYRARLDAVRQQAAVDGQSVDPWHLAAMIEGLRLRMDKAVRIAERGQLFEAARAALVLHQWITAPDETQAQEITLAERHLTAGEGSALLAAADGMWRWLEKGRPRAPMRAALAGFWQGRGLARHRLPLFGTAALAADAPEDWPEWRIAFLHALEAEAEDGLDLLRRLEREWWTARSRVAGRRRHSRAPASVDVLAAVPLISATRLAAALGMSIKAATELLDQFAESGIAVEVTHRGARRLFGLMGMTPLRERTLPPRRRVSAPPGNDQALPPALHQHWPAIDYGALDAALIECEQAVRTTRERLTARPR